MINLEDRQSDARFLHGIPFEEFDITFLQFVEWWGYREKILSKEKYLRMDYLTDETTKDVTLNIIERIGRVFPEMLYNWPVYLPGDENLSDGFRLRSGDHLSVYRVNDHLNSLMIACYSVASTKCNGSEYTCMYKGELYRLGRGPFNGVSGIIQTLDLYRLSLVLVKDDDETPSNPDAKKAWIARRVEHFRDLPAVDVMGACAFANTLNERFHELAIKSLVRIGKDSNPLMN